MDKPVDGAEALAREELGKHLEADGFLALAKSARGSGLGSMVAAMLAYSAALVAENERLRGALIAMGSMLPGVILDDRVSTALLCDLPAEMGHYRLVSPSQALADTDLRLAGVKEGLEMAAKECRRIAENAALVLDEHDARVRHEGIVAGANVCALHIDALGPRP